MFSPLKNTYIWTFIFICLHGSLAGSKSIDQKTRLIEQTNVIRKKHHLIPFTSDSCLTQIARKHSKEMTKLGYFSHESPNLKNKTMDQRFGNAAIPLINVCLGENLGVDYVLKISNIPYYREQDGDETIYINAKTGRKIHKQTYDEFAKTMVQQWMDSPPHRKNILNPQFSKIGIGASIGLYNQFQSVFITQNFLGHLGSHQ